MEYALWVVDLDAPHGEVHSGLNPYFDGICSLSAATLLCRANQDSVLILILMEYALWVWKNKWKDLQFSCLNPYFDGICSLREIVSDFPNFDFKVLILILMEYALWEEDYVNEEIMNLLS